MIRKYFKNLILNNEWISVLFLLLGCIIYALPELFKILYPSDLGTYAQSAERVLLGEVPHKDFIENYSGGLSYFHALFFHLFGIDASSLRYPLFFFSLLYVLSIYHILSRFIFSFVAAFLSFFIFVISVPAFPTESPSWYNVFIGTFGILSMILFIESGKKYGLFIAGLLGGLSLCFKITGLYYIAAIFVFLILLEQNNYPSNGKNKHHFKSLNIPVFIILSLLILCVLSLIKTSLTINVTVYLLLPIVSISLFLIYNDLTIPLESLTQRIINYATLVFPFLLGLMIPVGLFILYFHSNEALEQLYQGIFVTPLIRLNFHSGNQLPSLQTLLFILPYVFLLTCRIKPSVDKIIAIALIPILLWVLVNADQKPIYKLIWEILRYMSVAAVISGCLVLFNTLRNDNPLSKKDHILFLVITFVGLTQLIQYPFLHTLYYFYIWSSSLLLLFIVISQLNSRAIITHSVIFVFIFAFYFVWVKDSNLSHIGKRYSKGGQWELLTFQRGQAYMNWYHADHYNKIIPFILEKSKSDYFYATPDVPELYFFTGLKNPTKSIWDIFDKDFHAITSDIIFIEKKNFSGTNISIQTDFMNQKFLKKRNKRILDKIKQHKINVVVINNTPEASYAIDIGLAIAFEKHFRHWVQYNNISIGWNE